MSHLEQRYGTASKPRWVWWIVAGIGCGIGVAWAAWIALQDRPVSADIWGYDVISDTEVVVTVELRRPDPVAVECTVYAQAIDHSIVGERTVVFDASDETTVREKLPIETTERAVTAVLRGGCSVVEE